MGIALPLDKLQNAIRIDDVYSPIPFTDFHKLKESNSSEGILAIATVKIPSLKLNMKTIVHGMPISYMSERYKVYYIRDTWFRNTKSRSLFHP